MTSPDRRTFIKDLGVLGATWILRDRGPGDPLPAAGDPLMTTHTTQANSNQERRGDPAAVPKRPFGKTGEQVSIIGIGGYALGELPSEQDAVRLIGEAFDAGVNFLDNAWEYHDGRSEEWMGAAVQGQRDKFFLMTKVCSHGRDKQVAMRQLEESLKRLRTDYLDLWQIHEVVYENDPERHFASNGAVEALTEAKKQGKTRFVGFTGHKDPSIHLKMLSYDYPFDACQMPLNCFDATFRSFETRVLPELNRRGIAPIGMKSLGGTGDFVKKGVVTAQEALAYAMSLPVGTTVSGIDSMKVLEQNLAVARGFKKLSDDEMAALRRRCETYAADGRFELYKVSMRFEGPPGREQHGFPTPQQMGA